MPRYDYYCERNGRTVTVEHPVQVELRIWGEVCYCAQIPLGDTPCDAPVRKRLAPAPVHSVVGAAQLREKGFSKLVRRERGVYENVTAGTGEVRLVAIGDDADRSGE